MHVLQRPVEITAIADIRPATLDIREGPNAEVSVAQSACACPINSTSKTFIVLCVSPVMAASVPVRLWTISDIIALVKA